MMSLIENENFIVLKSLEVKPDERNVSGNLVNHRFFPAIQKFCDFLETDVSNPDLKTIINDLRLLVYLEGFSEVEIKRFNPEINSDESLYNSALLDGIGRTLIKSRMLCYLGGADLKFNNNRLNDYCEQMATDGLYELKDLEEVLIENMEDLKASLPESCPNLQIVEEIWDVTMGKKEVTFYDRIKKAGLTKEQAKDLLNSIGASPILKYQVINLYS